MKKMIKLFFVINFCLVSFIFANDNEVDQKICKNRILVEDENFLLEKISNEDNSKVYIEFFSEENTLCKILSPIYDAWSENLKKDGVYYKIDLKNAKKFAEKYNVLAVPTMLIFNGGKLVQEKVGLPDIACFLENFDDNKKIK